MDINEALEAVRNRATVRVSDRHGWAAGRTGIALGYNDTYNSMKFGFVDENGDYTGEFTTVPVSAVEPVVYRETTIRVADEEQTIRTEQGKRSVKQLEAAHTRAVREAVDAARIRARALRIEAVGEAPGDEYEVRRKVRAGWVYGPLRKIEEGIYESSVRQRLRHIRAPWQEAMKVAERVVRPRKAISYQDAQKLRRPYPPVRYTYPEIPASVREFAG